MLQLRCDQPGCAVTLRWVQQEVQDKPEALPDGAWRLLTLATFDGAVRGFCSKYCLLEYLRGFVPLKSPRELAEIALTEKAVAETAMTNEGGNLGVVGVTVPDATGFSEEL